MGMSNRRDFLLALGSVLALPRFALAQQAERTYRVGWLDSTVGRSEPYQVAFAQRLPELAADLARRHCDVFLTPGTEAGLVAIKQASQNTPIVIVANDYDPVATGHIASLARPGGRITGVSQLQSELPAKRLELLKELLPKAKSIAVFSDTATEGQLKTAQALGITMSSSLLVLADKVIQ